MALALCTPLLLAAAPGRAAPPEGANYPASAVIIDKDTRATPEDYARQQGLAPADVASRFGASGVVRCGGAAGTGQLVGSSGVIVTAAHVLFEEDGSPRGKGATGCTFDIVAGGRRQVVPIVVGEVVCGATEPYTNAAIRDWAVAPLAKPILGARPYALASSMAVPGPIVLAAAARAGGVENHSLELCAARKVTATSPTGMREVAIDCDAESGTSGAAFLTPGGGFLGVYVGFRSSRPGTAAPFSMTHYNFGVTADGALRKAITEMVAQNQPLSASR